MMAENVVKNEQKALYRVHLSVGCSLGIEQLPSLVASLHLYIRLTH